MASQQTVGLVLGLLSAEYPDHMNKLSPEQVRNLRNLYTQALSDIDDDILKAASLRHITESQWFPKVSELRSASARLIRPAACDPMEAWGAVLAAIRSVGFYGSPEFDDPLTALVVRQMGWRDLCMSEDATADRARFVDAYARQAQREHSRAVLPLALQDGAMAENVKQLTAGVARALEAEK